MNQKKIGVLLSYANIFASMAVNLLYTPVMLHLLGQSEYGIYSLSSSVIGYLSLLYGGMTSTYLWFHSKYVKQGEQAISRLNGLFLTLFAGMGLIGLVIGVVIAVHADMIIGGGLTNQEINLARILLLIMALNIAIQMPKTVFSTIIFSHERFVFEKSLGVITTFMSPCLTLPLLYLGYGSIGMSVIVLIITIIGLLAEIWYAFKRLHITFSFQRMPFHCIPAMASFSIFILLQGIMDQFNWQLGKLLLANLADSASIAVYAVGLQIALIVINLSVAFSGVVVPEIYQLVADNKRDELNALWQRIGRYQYFVMCFIYVAFFAFGQSFIRLWAGDGYDDAWYVAVLLMAPMAVHLCQLMAVEVLRARNCHGFWTIVHLLASIVGFLICIPLTQRYGVLGVAVGTCIQTFIILNIFDNWYYKKAGLLDVKSFFSSFLNLIPSAIMVMGIAAIISAFISIKSWGSFVAVIGVFALLYWLVIYFVAMNRQEKKQINVLLRRFC